MDGLFEEPQGAAMLKHEVLRQHLAVYVRTTGSRAAVVFPGRPGGRAAPPAASSLVERRPWVGDAA
jgi:hypothetical protein